ncbi:hypothetical protein AVEN_70879-1 [Araneus ventricosus]|uniref:Uncharacterized protein n=1 Tax=Araneus ventricosus TaxID=182803 RepID=A0A4Y2L7Y3_ARAVE|nr:hypothetical protein AVEN_70879-1 [Araneus ventricosus]
MAHVSDSSKTVNGLISAVPVFPPPVGVVCTPSTATSAFVQCAVATFPLVLARVEQPLRYANFRAPNASSNSSFGISVIWDVSLQRVLNRGRMSRILSMPHSSLSPRASG